MDLSEGLLEIINLYSFAIDTPSGEHFLYLSLPLSTWKSDLKDHYRKHHQVKKYIQDGKEPSVEFLKELLCFNEPSEITEEHLALCSYMYAKRISMPLPVPRTEHILPFTKLAGTER